MNMQRGVPDPYRELGVQRAATEAQIKAAHRKLAKRFHPDAQSGDTARFLAIQEAYTLLSDPLRRREWDQRHAPGPVRAGDPTRRGARPRAADGRWTREDGTPGGARPRPTSGSGGPRPRPAQSRPSGGAGAGQGSGGAGPRGAADPGATNDRRDNRADPDWNASGRDPSTRSYRWSAENVPWWEDFSPRAAGGQAGTSEAKGRGQRASGGSQPGARRQTPGSAGAGAVPGSGAVPRSGAGPGSGAAAGPGGAAGKAEQGVRPDHGDVYSRSSGAAWSSAARRYFRKGDEDLASRGAFVYRGTQVVTGAKAREASEEFLRQRPGVGAAPRQAFEPRPSDGPASQPGDGRTAPRGTGPGSTQARGPARDQTEARTYATGAERRYPDATPADRRGRPSLMGAATVGAGASFAVTMPMLLLSSLVLNPPLQPAFAAILLLVAALTGALAAATWARLRRDA